MNAKKQGGEGVPLLDLKKQFSSIRDEVYPLIHEIIESQQFILGEHVESLEKAIAEYSSLEHGIGVSSGTDALLLALMALDIGSGDEVITSAYTFFATAGVVARSGARPVFCDIDPATYNISCASVERFISEECEMRGDRLVNRKTGNHVKAMIPVHLYGQVADMKRVIRLAREYKLWVIEDSAQAIGAADAEGKKACSFGDVGCLSFFPTKNLGAFGDAGMCVTGNRELAERMRILRVHGGHPKYYHSLIGGNFRIDALQAAVLGVKIKYLDQWTAGRQKNAEIYDRAFANTSIQTPYIVPGCRHIYNQYVIRVDRRDELRAYLAERHIGTEIYYPVPLHMQECFEYLGYKPDDCPESRLAGETTLALPVYPELIPDQIEYVADCIKSFYG